MVARYRAAFTLVELLVVVAIIGVLVGLLMPAVISARERARVTQCMNHQGETGKAVLAYEMAKRHLPGYANTIMVNQLNGVAGRQPLIVSWAPILLPYLGRTDLWEAWRGGTTTGGSIQQFVCPSESTTVDDPMSYVVNVGQGTTLPSDNYSDCTSYLKQLQLSIFRNYALNHPLAKQNGAVKSVSMTDVRSAASRPMFTESGYFLSILPYEEPAPSQRKWSDYDVWKPEGGGLTGTAKITAVRLGFVWPATATPIVASLQKKSVEGRSRWVKAGGTIVPIHVGLINVFFCDGHAESLNNDPDSTCDKYDNSPIK